MHIVQLKSENIKRLHAVQITPAGHMVIVGGANGQGKSSVLDSIAMALGGGAEACAVPVHRGERKAVIVADLGEIVVTRTFTAGGSSTLEVKNKEGVPQKSPQGVLDALTGKLAFDPIAFTRLEPKEQRAALVKITGLDFSKLDADRAAAFSQRTAKNGEVKSAEVRLAAQPKHADAPAAEVSTAELLKELTAAQTHNQQKAVRQQAVADATRNWTEHVALIQQQVREVCSLEAALSEAKRKQATLEGQLPALDGVQRNKKSMLADFVEVDEGPIRARISGAGEINRKVQQNATRKTTEAELAAKRKEAEALTHRIEGADAQKAAALAAAKFPVTGLAFDEQGVTFNGLPFEQASSAEQLRVSVAIAAALNPKLRVMLVRDGSLLDEKSLALLGTLAAEFNLQVWVEVVGAGKECSVIIDDGAVSEVRDYATRGSTAAENAARVKPEPSFALASEDDL